MKKSQGRQQAADRKPKSLAMAAALEAAQGLAGLGAISKKTLRGYEKECLEVEGADAVESAKRAPRKVRPATCRITATDVARIRAKVCASQGYFAMQLQVSPSTVQQWESGAKKPGPMAAKLLEVVDKHGLEVLA